MIIIYPKLETGAEIKAGAPVCCVMRCDIIYYVM